MKTKYLAYLKPIVYNIAFLFLPALVIANAAAPGFWDAGHGSTIIPLFKKDSAAISKVQMQREYIFVNLYKNYAVVKGTYLFYNHSNKSEKIRTGYPINGENYAYGVDIVRFDDIYHLKVIVNGLEITSQKLTDYINTTKDNTETINPEGVSQVENWYVWDMEFHPLSVTKLEAYFIVKTPSILTQGYGKKKANAFEYILQTGSAWKDKINSGTILINFKDGLCMDDINGIYPLQRVYYNENQLYYQFKNIKPTADDDLIIWYQGDTTSSIDGISPKELFGEIDNSDTAALNLSNLKLSEKADFKTPTPGWSYILWALGIIAALVAIFFAITLIYLLYLGTKKIIENKS